ncbi:hypothetical protein RUND412_002590 [Rhizina undulata]
MNGFSSDNPKPRNGYLNGAFSSLNGSFSSSTGNYVSQNGPSTAAAAAVNGVAGAHTNGTGTASRPSGRYTNGVSKNVSKPTTNGNSLPSEEPYDLICIGFGPASLAIAIALRDKGTFARVLFLERQPQFAWHAGMLLPGSRMQISFIKDLATMRNPRSEFTFLNYLHKKDRLVTFTNLGTFLPLREEYNDYMSWCASHFEDSVRYSEDVISVSPTGTARPVKLWGVTSRNIKTGDVSSLKARHVVIAVGGKPNIPAAFPQNPLNPKIIHSSGYSTMVPKLLDDKNRAYNVAVVGGGQSAAEIFNDIQIQYPNSKTSLFIKQSALRPSDDSPFVNEIFNPERVDGIYALPTDIRKESIHQDRATNYGVVRLELIEKLYETMYHQRLRNPDESTWAHRIFPLREVVGVEQNKLEEVYLKLRDTRNDEIETTAGFDVVIIATGYVRNAHETLLKPAKSLMKDECCAVTRDYRVKFKEGAVDENAGIWLQGCNESTHGLSDSLLSIIAVRGGEMVDSIFGKDFEGLVKSEHEAVIERSIKRYTNVLVKDIARELSLGRIGNEFNGLLLNGHA